MLKLTILTYSLAGETPPHHKVEKNKNKFGSKEDEKAQTHANLMKRGLNTIKDNTKNEYGQDEEKLGEELDNKFPFDPSANLFSLISEGRESAPSFFMQECDSKTKNFEFLNPLPKMEENIKNVPFNRKS